MFKTIQNAIPTLFIFLISQTAFANEEKYECSSKASGISSHLTIAKYGKNLTDFEYLAVSLTDQGPPFPSCSIEGTKREGGESGSEWKETSEGYVIKLLDSASKNDKVLIKKRKNGYTFDFGNISPLNCGPSSGIAEIISIRFDSKHCQVKRVRN